MPRMSRSTVAPTVAPAPRPPSWHSLLRRLRIALPVASLLGLAGCDLLGLESASDVAARRDAEGKAVGGACRQAARSIEECYEHNKRADKAAVFTGWREMNDYMRENNLQAQPEGERATPRVADAGVETEPRGAAEAGAKADAKPDADAADQAAPPGKGAGRPAGAAGNGRPASR
jgi:hypothetical protein